MSALRVVGPATVTAGKPTPIMTGPVVAAVSFSITKGIATINLGASNLPATGYRGSNPTLGGSALGQQVILWGFTTATYFNGKRVTVLDNDGNGSFRFAFNHADVGSTNDAGNTAPAPIASYRVVRVEVTNSVTNTHFVYVGDGTVSATNYTAALSTASGGQLAFTFSGDNIDPSRIFIDGSNSGDTVQVSVAV